MHWWAKVSKIVCRDYSMNYCFLLFTRTSDYFYFFYFVLTILSDSQVQIVVGHYILLTWKTYIMCVVLLLSCFSSIFVLTSNIELLCSNLTSTLLCIGSSFCFFFFLFFFLVLLLFFDQRFVHLSIRCCLPVEDLPIMILMKKHFILK